MPLTPEDVVNKRFNATRVREGYAQEEVDDFLDEVVEELRRLQGENDDLRQRLQQAEQRIGELNHALESRDADAGGGVDAQGHEAAAEELRRLQAENDELRERLQQAEQRASESGRLHGEGAHDGGVHDEGLHGEGFHDEGAHDAAAAEREAASQQELGRLNSENEELRLRLQRAEERVEELARAQEAASAPSPEEVAAPVAGALDGGPAGEIQQAAGVLALAQRLHDEYVREAESQRDRILAEAQATAERLVSEAREERERVLGLLEGERLDLEGVIGRLRTFEVESRTRLSEYFQNQLEELQRQAPRVAEPAVADSVV